MKPHLLSIVKFSTFLILTWKGLLHFTSVNNYNILFDSPQVVASLFGFILMLGGFVSLYPSEFLKKTKIHFLFLVATIIVVIDSMFSMIAKNGMIEQLIEHALQIIVPFSVFVHFHMSEKSRNWKEIFYFGLFFTFIGHGLFAIGVHVVPDNFIHMTQAILGFDLLSTKSFLWVMGIMDFVAAVCIFFKSTRKPALWYMAIWGISTALARPLAEISEYDSITFYTVHLPNFIYRLPHGLIPIYFLSRIYNWQLVTKKGFVFS